MPHYCKGENCKKQSTFNYKNGKPRYCKAHKSKGMINVKDKLCMSCNRIALFNYKNETVFLYCSQHKLKDMVNIKHKTCKFEDCFKRTDKHDFCSNHRTFLFSYIF